jgi:hypothetical protein
METKAEAERRAAPETQATNDRRHKEDITPGRITLIDEAEALMRPVLRTNVANNLIPATTQTELPE